MSTLKVEQTEARALHVKVTADTLTVDLTDGRTISVPLAWFPRLLHGSVSERNNWRLIARGEGIPHDELLREFGLKPGRAQHRDHRRPPSTRGLPLSHVAVFS